MSDDRQNRDRRCSRHLIVLLLAIVLYGGCASSHDEPSAVITGKVTLGQAPVTAGSVLFMTDDGLAASAELTPDGTYRVQCRPGRFKVAVTPPPQVDPLSVSANAATAQPIAGQQIPKRYQDLGSSGLTIEVKEGENTYNIVLAR